MGFQIPVQIIFTSIGFRTCTILEHIEKGILQTANKSVT